MQVNGNVVFQYIKVAKPQVRSGSGSGEGIYHDLIAGEVLLAEKLSRDEAEKLTGRTLNYNGCDFV